jgi:hypothetical protein
VERQLACHLGVAGETNGLDSHSRNGKLEPIMTPCDKPVSELTVGEAANCVWVTFKDSVISVVTHPASATIADWIITVLSGLTLLYILSLLLFRR